MRVDIIYFVINCISCRVLIDLIIKANLVYYIADAQLSWVRHQRSELLPIKGVEGVKFGLTGAKDRKAKKCTGSRSQW